MSEARDQNRTTTGANGPSGGGTNVTNVYILEDNPGDVELIRACLAREGDHRITHFATLSELRALEGDWPDVLLLDLRLPDGVEAEVIKRAQALFAEVPLVVLTGFDSGALAHRCLEWGADDYIEKSGMTAHGLRRAIGFAVARGRARALQKRLQVSEKLATLGRLAAGVAHEINNPATFVLVNLEMMVQKLSNFEADADDLSPPVERLLCDVRIMSEEARNGVERIAAIVKDLSGFSRMDIEDRVPVSLNPLVRRVCAGWGHKLTGGVSLVLDVPMDLVALGDGPKVEQILSNLVSNALDALKGHRNGHEGVVKVAGGVRGDRALLSVEDNAGGVPSDLVGRIFDPFFTTKTRGYGTGLGLAISAEAAAQMGGRLTLARTGPEGSRFELSLPLSSADVPEAPTAPSRTAARGRRLHVMFVEDDDAVARAFFRIIGAAHTATRAQDAEQALVLLDGGQRFDVILCDLIMPGMGGIGFFRALERRHPELLERVVLCSGGLVDDETRRFVESTGLPVLEKPVRSDELLGCLERIAARAPGP